MLAISEMHSELGRVSGFNQSWNRQHQMKDYVGTDHFTEFDDLG